MPANPDQEQEMDSAVPVPIEEVLDLHPFHPRDIPSVVEEYLREAAARGFQEVRLIHGRGIGFQRQVVQDLLARHPLVVRFADAPPERGGWGASLVWLKPPGAGPPHRQPE
ncbi:MAG: Smr/MutS family protein [Candidatus Methylomirabilales bacterium]